MKRTILTALTLLGVFIACPAWSQQTEPFVEITVTPEEVAVGEPVTMRVSIFVPTWFATPPDFPSFEIPNAVTRLPPDSSRPTSRRIGRERWTGIARNYQVFPLLGARFRLENQAFDIRYANPGADPVMASVETGEIVFTAYVPEGAESLDPYVAGSRLELLREIEGNDGELAVGDAVVVTYTAELEGLSAVFLPELLEPTDVPGVSAYPEQPVLEDGDMAKRSEKVTYIFNAGGDFELPAVAIDWWNRESAQIETATVAALPITVAGPPPVAELQELPGAERNWWPFVAALALLALLYPWLKVRAEVMLAKREARERAHLASEPYGWEQARKALAGGDTHRAHHEIVRWLDRLEPGLGTRDFAARYGDVDLARELAVLNGELYGKTGEQADLGIIERRLAAARKRCLAQHQQGLDVALPPLNP